MYTIKAGYLMSIQQITIGKSIIFKTHSAAFPLSTSFPQMS
jgi:hypothetical protein